MTRCVLVVAVAAGVFAATGCKPRETRIDGDVFIVTKGAQNFKLGLVEVRFIPEREMEPAISAAMEKTKAAVQTLSNKLRDAEYEVAMADMNLAGAPDTSGITAALMQRAAALESPEGKKLYERIRAEHLQNLELRRAQLAAKAKALEAARSARSELRTAQTGYAVAGEFGSAAAAVKTDADGKFVATLPPGRYAAVATATRVAGEDTEHYCWIVWVTAQGERLRLMLTNDNIATTDCPDCVLHLGDLARVKPQTDLPKSR